MNEDYESTTITAINKDQLELDLDDSITVTLDNTLSTMNGTVSGQVLTTTGAGGLSWGVTSGGYSLNSSITNGTWANPIYNDSITIGDYSLTAGDKALNVKGDANFDGDIKLKGKSLSDVLDNIEKRLAILHPNPELEERWERLKSLGDMYRELEQEILEKEQVWDILKK